MKPGLTRKILAVLILATTLAVAVTAGIVQWSIQRGFMQFVSEVEHDGVPRLVLALENEYAAAGSWEALRSDPQRWRQLAASALYSDAVHTMELPPGGAAPPPPGMLPPHIARQFDRRLLLADAGRRVIIGEGDMGDARIFPVRRNGDVIGYLGMLPQRQPSGDAQRHFLRQQYRTLLAAAGIVIAASALLSLFMARRMVRPLRDLALATRRLASGDYRARAPVASDDELGEVARDFNSMAQTLEKNEQTRRQWVADISHELRTPLTFLRSQVEALQDGIRQPTPESLAALHREVSRLGRLVDDLHQLSLSDIGAQTCRIADVALSRVIHQALSMFRTDFAGKEIALRVEAADDLAVSGDTERLLQLFANLIENSMKYTDPGGELSIRARRDGGWVVVDVQDSAPGVAEEELERLFERLYRVESSRCRATGGAGLGLAICRTIVGAHGGIITAQSSPLGGVWVRVELPGRGGSDE